MRSLDRRLRLRLLSTTSASFYPPPEVVRQLRRRDHSGRLPTVISIKKTLLSKQIHRKKHTQSATHTDRVMTDLFRVRESTRSSPQLSTLHRTRIHDLVYPAKRISTVSFYVRSDLPLPVTNLCICKEVHSGRIS